MVTGAGFGRRTDSLHYLTAATSLLVTRHENDSHAREHYPNYIHGFKYPLGEAPWQSSHLGARPGAKRSWAEVSANTYSVGLFRGQLTSKRAKRQRIWRSCSYRVTDRNDGHSILNGLDSTEMEKCFAALNLIRRHDELNHVIGDSQLSVTREVIGQLHVT